MSDPERLATLTKLRQEAAEALSSLRWRHENAHSDTMYGPMHPPDPWTEEDRAEERRLQDLVAGYDTAMRQELQPGTKASSGPEPIVWYGQRHELVGEIIAWRKRGLIIADSDSKALTAVKPHFVFSDGKRLNVRADLQHWKRKQT